MVAPHSEPQHSDSMEEQPKRNTMSNGPDRGEGRSAPGRPGVLFWRSSLFTSYFAILAPFRGLSLLSVTLTAFSGLCEGLALLALIPVLQRSEEGATLLGFQGEELFHLGLAGFLLLGAGTAILTYASQATVLELRARVERLFRAEMSRALLSMEWTRYLSLREGDIGKSLIMEGFQIAAGTRFFIQGLGLCCVAVVFVFIALSVSVEMTCYTLMFGACAVLVHRALSAKGHAQADRLSELLSGIGQQVAEIFNHLKFFRGSGRSARARDEAGRMFDSYARTFRVSQKRGELVRLFLELGAVFFITVFLWVMLKARGYSVAQALVFLAVFYRLTPRLASMQKSFYQARGALSFYWTWKQRRDMAVEAPARRFGSRPPAFERELVFQGVGYTYPEAGSPALLGVDLTLPRRGFLAVTGASGSGKSTLLDLVLGLLSASRGRILLDGVPLEEVDIEAWRGRIGLVLQESPIFHASVLDNIAWGEDAPDPEKAMEAARMAQCMEFIQALPQGMHSVVGQGGGRLSGGERQRLALARALYRDPWLLMLDEATSALDEAAEAKVLAALDRLKGRCAILMVTHRPGAVNMADKTIVLHRGRVAEIRKNDSTP